MRTITLLSATALLLASPVAAQWSTATLSEGRYGIGATIVGDKALFAGGINAVGAASNRVDIYDNVTGVWSTASLSIARGQLAAAAVGTRALFAGGTDGTTSSDQVDLYDAATNTWSTATLTSARWSLAAASVGTKVLFAGGFWSDAVDIYDNSTGTWSTAALSQVRGDLTATVVGTRVYFAGGWSGAPSDVVDVYDDSNGTWTVLNLSVARNRLAAANVGNTALFAGGGSTAIGLQAEVDLLNTTTGVWSMATLSQPRELLAGARAGSKVLFAGGYDGVSLVTTAAVDIYDASTGTWTTDTLSAPRWGLAAVSFGNRALFAGGAASAVVDIYDTSFPIGTNYCNPASPNTTGGAASISAFGSVVASANDVTLHATAMPPNQFGIFITSPNAGFVPMPGGSQGNLCLGSPIGRYNAPGQVLNSGSVGMFSLLLNLPTTPTPTGPVAVMAGQTRRFQAWYRDFLPGMGAVSNFTNGLAVSFQ